MFSCSLAVQFSHVCRIRNYFPATKHNILEIIKQWYEIADENIFILITTKVILFLNQKTK